MQHKEADASILFRHWLRRYPLYTCAFEMKDTRGKDSLLFSEVKVAQVDYGMAIKSDKGVLIRTTGIEGLPDYIYLRSEPSYIVIKYPKSFEIIDIETFEEERKRSKRKSLTSDRAKEISVKSVKLSTPLPKNTLNQKPNRRIIK